MLANLLSFTLQIMKTPRTFSARTCAVVFLGTFLNAFAHAQHRPGYHHPDHAQNESNFLPAFRVSTSQNRRYDHEALGAVQAHSSEGKMGYIILSMKDSVEDAHPGTSTARIQEISGMLEGNEEEEDIDEEQVSVKRELEADHLNRTNRKITINSNYMFGGYVRREIWAIPLISIVLLNLFLIVLFEIYVLCQSRGRNPLFLGQVLLMGLLFCSGFSLVFVVGPSTLNCFFGTIGISVAYALIFSVLLVKSVFLISLDAGNNLSWAFQACLLFFAVLVQVAISTQFMLIFPPSLHHVSLASAHKFPAQDPQPLCAGADDSRACALLP